MGSIVVRKTGNGEIKYQAHVRRKGHSARVATFNSRTRAKAWIQRVEAAIQEHRDLPQREALRKTFADWSTPTPAMKATRSFPAASRPSGLARLAAWVDVLGEIKVAELTPAPSRRPAPSECRVVAVVGPSRAPP